MRLPGVKAARSSSVTKTSGRVGILQHAVDDDVVVGQEVGHRDASVGGVRPDPVGCVRVGAHLQDLGGVDRRRDGGDVAVGQHAHVVDAVGVQRGDGAAGGRAEPDDGGAQPAAVAAGDPDQLPWRAAPSSSPPARCSCGRRAGRTRRRTCQWFIASNAISVSRRSMAIWVRAVSCTQCGHPQTIWPVTHLRQVLGLHLGQQDDVAVGDRVARGCRSRRPGRPVRRRWRRTRSRTRARGRSADRSAGSILSKCCRVNRQSVFVGLREWARIPSESCSPSTVIRLRRPPSPGDPGWSRRPDPTRRHPSGPRLDPVALTHPVGLTSLGSTPTSCRRHPDSGWWSATTPGSTRARTLTARTHRQDLHWPSPTLLRTRI